MARASLHRLRNTWQIKILGGSFIILVACETLLVIDILTEFLGFNIDFYDENHLTLEAVAVFSLGVTLFVIGFDFWRLVNENRQFRSLLGIASGEFLYIMGSKFQDWHLSVSEREIALLLIKGLSIQEIADIRETKPGTIKSQCSAIYRKAEVKGRNELVAYFVEDLLAGDSLTEPSSNMPPPIERADPTLV